MTDSTLMSPQSSKLVEELLQKVPWDDAYLKRNRLCGRSLLSTLCGGGSRSEMKAAGLILWMPVFQRPHSSHLLGTRAQEYTTSTTTTTC